MAVLIKGMEMPKSCDSCRIMVFEDTNCVDELYCGCPIVFEAHPQGVGRRPDYCPLIEVPEPHGDLIDADKLKETLDYYISEAGWSDEINKALSWVKDEFIDSEQAIIPAGEEG